PNHTFPPLVGHVDGHVASVYMLDVRENRRLRTNERRLDPVTRTWRLPPHRVDCHYLITAWSGATAASGIDPTIEEHKLLSRIAKAFLDEGSLSFARTLSAAKLAALPPELVEAELPLTVGPGEGFAKLAEFWGTMGAKQPWRPGVYLVVTLPLIATTDLEPGPPVDTIFIESAAAIGVAAATASFERDLVVGGIVVDAANRPVSGARVDLLSSIGVRTAVHSNGNGQFTLPGLEPGLYRLRCSHPDHPTPIPQAVTVPLPSGPVRLVLS
ncbi:MAG TPA: Pvc16 family protein, partial [Gaiellaceae bacterium]